MIFGLILGDDTPRAQSPLMSDSAIKERIREVSDTDVD
jgi:hypothetical protein